jgi:hypothetical protein
MIRASCQSSPRVCPVSNGVSPVSLETTRWSGGAGKEKIPPLAPTHGPTRLSRVCAIGIRSVYAAADAGRSSNLQALSREPIDVRTASAAGHALVARCHARASVVERIGSTNPGHAVFNAVASAGLALLAREGFASSIRRAHRVVLGVTPVRTAVLRRGLYALPSGALATLGLGALAVFAVIDNRALRVETALRACTHRAGRALATHGSVARKERQSGLLLPVGAQALTGVARVPLGTFEAVTISVAEPLGSTGQSGTVLR